MKAFLTIGLLLVGVYFAQNGSVNITKSVQNLNKKWGKTIVLKAKEGSEKLDSFRESFQSACKKKKKSETHIIKK